VSSVDPARARDTVELLTALARERGFTLIVSLHDVRLARELFPRLCALRHGRLTFDRRAADVGQEELEALYRLERAEVLADGA
jgi:phosphonate transport system ATP-binding protein